MGRGLGGQGGRRSHAPPGWVDGCRPEQRERREARVAIAALGVHDPQVRTPAGWPEVVAVHDDLGLLPDGSGGQRVVLIDWQFVGPGAPAVDLSWYLYCSGPGRPHAKEAVIACYRDCLARRLGSRFAEAWWRPQLELSLLGQTLRCAQDMAWAAVRHESPAVQAWARDELAWWSDQAAAGARRLP